MVQKVKQLKKAGKTSPIKGYAILVGNGDLVSISGTAVARSDGEVYYGVTIHNLLQGKDQSVAGSWDPENGHHHDPLRYRWRRDREHLGLVEPDRLRVRGDPVAAGPTRAVVTRRST